MSVSSDLQAEIKDSRFRELEAERDALRKAAEHAEAVLSIVEPRSHKAEYLQCLQELRDALAGGK